jgi:Asp/Glu/hydantoin racemase
MRIWFQLLSSEKAMRDVIAGTQALVDTAASPGTTVEVHGTPEGALGDDYRLFWHYDVREVIENGLRIRQSGGYDAFVIANSLDPGLTELREIMEIPVLSFMEVSCSTALMMGDSFGLVVPNDKFSAHYKEIVTRYGMRDRLTAIEPLSYDNVRDIGPAFKAGGALTQEIEAAARRVVASGAEVVICPGPAAAMMAQAGIHQIDGVPILDSYRLLVKTAEAWVGMHRLTGVHVSRRRLYRSPPPQLLEQCARVHDLPLLRRGSSSQKRGS